MLEKQRTILIVDDSPEDRAAYRRYLQQDSTYTYTILEEEYGENGLELCKLLQPDAIVLDFKLPDIDGLEFLSELKTQSGKPKLPVIMLTGQGNEAIAVAALKGGAEDYLVKGETTSESLRLAIHSVIERAHLHNLLEQSEERFRTSVENILDCFGIYSAIRDCSGEIIDFRTEYVNTAACANNYTTLEALIGKQLCEVLPGHRDTELFQEYCQVVETGKPLVKESFVYSDSYGKQYLTRAFDIRATKLGDGFVATWRDVTERKQTEERLRLLESVVVNTNDAVIITTTTPIDEPGPRILYVNEAFTRMTGYSPGEVLGQSPRLLQGPETDRATLAQIRTSLQAKQPVEAQLINYRKDGSPFWMETSIIPVANDAQEYTHFIAIQRDITERKRLEAERNQLLVKEQAARAEAETANRAKDEFLAMVSHELRNPITAILGYAQMLRHHKLEGMKVVRALETIERNAKLQAQLIEDLLDISRITSGRFLLNIRQTDLIVVIEAAIDTVQLAAQNKSIDLRFSIAGIGNREWRIKHRNQQVIVGEELSEQSVASPQPLIAHRQSQKNSKFLVLGDANRLQQVVWNLLTNAIKFTPEGGSIRIHLDRLNHHAQVIVSDTGEGISPEFLPYIFERFRQADTLARQGGLGLGLAIARHLIELHGGTIRAESPGEGLGATFTIQLPLIE